MAENPFLKLADFLVDATILNNGETPKEYIDQDQTIGDILRAIYEPAPCGKSTGWYSDALKTFDEAVYAQAAIHCGTSGFPIGQVGYSSAHDALMAQTRVVLDTVGYSLECELSVSDHWRWAKAVIGELDHERIWPRMRGGVIAESKWVDDHPKSASTKQHSFVHKGGRPPINKPHDEHLFTGWQRAKAEGLQRCDYARSEGISKSQLDASLERTRKRRERKNKSADKS